MSADYKIKDNLDNEFKHFTVPELPMEMICMDLVGPISPVTTTGNRYILTVIDMLMGYTIVVPIPDKRSETVCGAYRDSVYCTFGGSSRILTDNGTEFKSQEMKAICEELNIKHVFSPVYTPQANGRLEGWHRFPESMHCKAYSWNRLRVGQISTTGSVSIQLFPMSVF